MINLHLFILMQEESSKFAKCNIRYVIIHISRIFQAWPSSNIPLVFSKTIGFINRNNKLEV